MYAELTGKECWMDPSYLAKRISKCWHSSLNRAVCMYCTDALRIFRNPFLMSGKSGWSLFWTMSLIVLFWPSQFERHIYASVVLQTFLNAMQLCKNDLFKEGTTKIKMDLTSDLQLVTVCTAILYLILHASLHSVLKV